MAASPLPLALRCLWRVSEAKAASRQLTPRRHLLPGEKDGVVVIAAIVVGAIMTTRIIISTISDIITTDIMTPDIMTTADIMTIVSMTAATVGHDVPPPSGRGSKTCDHRKTKLNAPLGKTKDDPTKTKQDLSKTKQNLSKSDMIIIIIIINVIIRRPRPSAESSTKHDHRMRLP